MNRSIFFALLIPSALVACTLKPVADAPSNGAVPAEAPNGAEGPSLPEPGAPTDPGTAATAQPTKPQEPPPPPARTSIQLRNSCGKQVRLQIDRGSVLHTTLNSNTFTSQSISDGDTIKLMDEKDSKELGKVKIEPGMKEVEIQGSGCDQIKAK